jgi:4-hydroxy-3-methylbut-2-enyl diphosphate reductase
VRQIFRRSSRIPPHCKDGPSGPLSAAPHRDSVLPLGDATRGARTWPCSSAVSNLREPAAPTPPSGGLSHFLRRANAALIARGYPARALLKRVLLASPRGYCAGVERAVETVERALALYGAPVYVRKQIVHNLHVVRELEALGAIFVESVHDVPEGAPVVFSAHGVAPAVRDAANKRSLTSIDATCPLVTKVHTQARRFAAQGYTIVLIGHAGHEEVEGTQGEAPESIVLVESVADAEALPLPSDTRLAYITQTTLSVDETREIVDVLRRRFPAIVGPQKEDICYATSNRQWAVKELLDQIELLLVVGSTNSSNSVRLVEVARAAGVQAHLIDDASEIDEAWVEGVETAGVTSGASAPERLVVEVCDWFRARGVEDIGDFKSRFEDVVFRLPVELRRAERDAA